MENKTVQPVTARQMQNEYQAEWRKKNPGKAQEHIKSYWQRRADEVNQANKEADND